MTDAVQLVMNALLDQVRESLRREKAEIEALKASIEIRRADMEIKTLELARLKGRHDDETPTPMKRRPPPRNTEPDPRLWNWKI